MVPPVVSRRIFFFSLMAASLVGLYNISFCIIVNECQNSKQKDIPGDGILLSES